MEAIQKRWKFKLGLDFGFELPESIKLDQVKPENIPDSELLNVEQPGVTPATMRLYIEKVSPFNIEGYSKNLFLDDQIERLYLAVEAQRLKKHEMIKRVKTKVNSLE